MKIANYILLLVELAVVFSIFFGTPYGHFSLGYGIGDILLVLYTIPVVIHLVLTIVMVYDKKSDRAFGVLISFFTIILCYFMYHCTYGRSGENHWDGNVFFMGCAHRIPIFNKNNEVNSKRIAMCSMVYHSEVVGKSTGKGLLLLEKGTIKVPYELKNDIIQPITKFYIESERYGSVDTLTKRFVEMPTFSADTLRQNELYIFTGEISKIIDGVPVLQGRLREKGWISPISSFSE